jgi:DNA invertase Pin-like site-specific DNA recombinase
MERDTTRAIGYLRVSTSEQDESKAGLEWQESVIRDEATRRGWTLDLRTDVASGKSMRGRGELGRTLRDLRDGKADLLVVAKLDRLSRSVLDFANLMESAVREGWSLVVLDLAVDMTTTNGRLISHIMIALAQWERELIGDRTRAGLASVRARGTKVGRRSGISDDTRRLIAALRSAGQSWQRIADALTEQGVPTGQGGKWHASTVRRIANP